MKKLLIATVALSGLFLVQTYSSAADDKAQTISGVLIDQACGGKQMSKDDPEKSAAGHPKACAMKEGCAKSGYAIISGKKMYKLDEASAKKAMEYLGKDDTTSTKVKVTGTVDGETLKVDSIAKG